MLGRKIMQILLAVAIICTIGTTAVQAYEPNCPASTEYTINYMIYTGQEKIIKVYPWPEETACITYYPGEKGTRTFTASHTWLMEPLTPGIVKFYWRDASNPNDPWHYWDTKNFQYFYPNAKTTLYSGSSSIGYLFAITQYADVPINVKVNII